MKYTYRCFGCKKKFHIQVNGAVSDVVCPKCGSRDVVKLINKPHIIFKGSGWGKDKK
jgi:putative FmdB family regulatory protein